MFESFIGHVSRMSHGLLADCVDTSLAIIVYYRVVQQMRCSVKCTISERAEKHVRIADALSLCGS